MFSNRVRSQLQIIQIIKLNVRFIAKTMNRIITHQVNSKLINYKIDQWLASKHPQISSQSIYDKGIICFIGLHSTREWRTNFLYSLYSLVQIGSRDNIKAGQRLSRCTCLQVEQTSHRVDMFCILGRKPLFRSSNFSSLHTIRWIKHFSAVNVNQEVLPRTKSVLRPASWQYRCMTDQSSNWKTVYEGPISRSVKLVKLLSLTTAAATLVCSPLLVLFGNQATSASVKTIAVFLLCTIGTGSTALLHFVTKSYVLKMDFNPKEMMFAVETLSLLALRKRVEFPADDTFVYPDDRAFSTFEAHGRKYFIHKELVEAQQVLHFIEKWQKEEATEFKKSS